MPSKITKLVDAYADETEIPLLRLDPADVYDDAIIGVVERAGSEAFLVYDRNKVITQAMQQEGWSYEDAVEWHEHNTFSAWMGDGTPAFLTWSPTE